MKFKKTLAVLMATICVLSMFGCAKQNSTATEESNPVEDVSGLTPREQQLVGKWVVESTEVNPESDNMKSMISHSVDSFYYKGAVIKFYADGKAAVCGQLSNWTLIDDNTLETKQDYSAGSRDHITLTDDSLSVEFLSGQLVVHMKKQPTPKSDMAKQKENEKNLIGKWVVTDSEVNVPNNSLKYAVESAQKMFYYDGAELEFYEDGKVTMAGQMSNWKLISENELETIPNGGVGSRNEIKLDGDTLTIYFTNGQLVVTFAKK